MGGCIICWKGDLKILGTKVRNFVHSKKYVSKYIIDKGNKLNYSHNKKVYMDLWLCKNCNE